MSTATIRNLTFLVGLLLLLLAIFYMPQSGDYTSTEITVATFFAVTAIAIAILIAFINPEANNKEIHHIYEVLEKNKLWKVSNKLLLGLVFVASIVFSAIFVKKQGDFLNFLITMSTVVLCLAVIQYYKAIPIFMKEC